MIFTEIVIENFGPYRGEQVLRLPSGSPSLIIVFGENGTGKTTFLNAIRWCLYGYARGRRGDLHRVRDLINNDEFRDGNRSAAVQITAASDEGAHVVLRREVRARDGVSDPDDDDDFETNLDVTVNGTVLPMNNFDEVVNDLLPEDISRFFLFDGELLAEYEELVAADASKQAVRVKGAIEQVLGVPAAVNARDDAAALRAEAARAVEREGKKHKAAEKASERLADALDERDAAEGDLAALESQQQEIREEIAVLETDLAKFESFAGDAKEHEDLGGALADLAKERAGLVKDRMTRVKLLWRDILEPRVTREEVRLQAQISAMRDAREEATKRIEREGELRAMLDDSTCAYCGQDLDESHMAECRAELRDLEKEIASSDDPPTREAIQRAVETSERLRNVAPAGVADGIALLEDRIRDVDARVHKATQRRQALMDQMSGIDPAKIREFQHERDERNQLLGRIDEQIKGLEDDLVLIRSRVAKAQDDIEKANVPELQRLTLQRDTFEALEVLFDGAIGDLTALRSEAVARQGSKIFLGLASDGGYEGLKINENYGLSIVGPGGNDIPVRSAGYEQVVALALIGALNMQARKRGPVIMDTPFGRLDKTHRSNILTYLATMASQVILLVHSGEVDPERGDLDPIASVISAEFRIVHPTPERSAIEAA